MTSRFTVERLMRRLLRERKSASRSRPLIGRRKRKRAPEHSEVSTYDETEELPQIGAPSDATENTESDSEVKIYNAESEKPAEPAGARFKP